MVNFLTNTTQTYDCETVQIYNRPYKNVRVVETKDFQDIGDPTVKSITRAEAIDGTYSIYAENGEMKRSTKYYGDPVTRVINGKKYKNIHSCVMVPDGTKVYETISPMLSVNHIEITPDGRVIDYAERDALPITKAIKRIGKQVSKFAKNVIRMAG